MAKHVILLTDAHESPAQALVDAMRDAGVSILIEVLREAEVEARLTGERGESAKGEGAPQPLAILYEVLGGVDILEIHAAIEHATVFWPDAPLIACRRNSPHALRPLDGSMLKRLGFRAVADEPAQLPALLRRMEERGTTGELPTSENIERAFLPGALLPQRLKTGTLRAAFEMVASLHFANDQKSAAHTALAGLAPLIDADRWAIYLTSETSGAEASSLEPLAVRGLLSGEREVAENDWRRMLLGDAISLLGSESKAVREAAESMEIIKRREKQKRIVAVPLINGDRALGVLEAVREGVGRRSFKPSEVALLDALAVPLTSALSNSVRIAEAERLSQTDDLTKLHNARYLRQFLLNEIKRARRYGSSVAAIFFDLDDFKQINDRHGHLVGSHVLMEMAAITLSGVRDTDAVARYGGDEFVVILPETGIEQAIQVAERLREKVARHEFTGGRRHRLKLTASFGVAAFPQHAPSPQQLIACADTAMYEAKAAHKNCVRQPSHDLAPTTVKNEKVIS
jgi:diguanylate cyclase (GGDEF)-like protein